MPKLERWLIASKKVDVLDRETQQQVQECGGQIGGGWYEVHVHICVNPQNKEQIEQLLEDKGIAVSAASDHTIIHPECMAHTHGGGI